MTEQITNTKTEKDTYGTYDMLCPHCGEEQDTADARSSDGEWSCEQCDKRFKWHIEWEAIYYTEKR